MRGFYRKLCAVSLILFAICGFVALHPAKTVAAINPQINFQGKLTNPDGTNVTDGTYSIVFSLYSVSTGGTAIWTETQSSVSVSSGIFQVALGSVTALPGSVDFNTAGIYLGIKVGSDAEMTPRIQFTAAPYAFNADKLDGLDSTGLVQLGPGSVQNDVSTNPSIYLNKTAASGNLIELQKSGSDVFAISNSGTSTTTGSAVIQAAGYTSNLVTINNGSTAALPAIPGSLLPSLVIHDSQTAASKPLFLGYDNGSGTGWAGYIDAGQCAAYTQMCLDFGSGTTDYTSLENTGTTLNVGGGDDGNFTDVIFKNSGRVIIGSTTTDATQVLLNLDSFSNFADTATCNATTNQGAMYYNTASGSMRACVNGGWEDMVSTGGLGILAFGVVPDSSNAGTMGDVAGVSGYSNSPCKVVWTATQQVTVEPCTAYSGGRKILIPSTVLSTSALAANTFSNICLTGSGGLPALGAGNTTETSAALPAFNVNNPVACLATVKTSATAGNVGFIWDTRTFTNTQKQFTTINSANNDGMLVMGTTTMGAVQVPSITGTGPIRGVIVATAGTASTNTINGIIATQGLAFVKFISGGTATINNCAETLSTTAGYGTSVACSATTASNFAYGGLLESGISTSCTTTNTVASACQYAPLVDFHPSR